MNIRKRKYFPYLLGLATILIAGTAAFFSVFGLSKVFAGASMSIIIMAGSLEFGKILGASFLYRYWDKINKLMRIYLTTGVIILVLITSMGIFGFLSSAYQGATTTFEKESTELLLLEEQLESAKLNKQDLLAERDEQVNSYPENYATKRRETRELYGNQIVLENTRILDLTNRVSDLKIKLIDSGVDVGPAIYIARAFKTSVDNVVKIFILILIFVFDPFAITLVIATNVVLTNKFEKEPDLVPIVSPTLNYIEKEDEVVTNWKEKRKDIYFNKDEEKVVEIEKDSSKTEKPIIEDMPIIGDGRKPQ